MIRILSLAFTLTTCFYTSFAQNIKLVGSWQLENVTIENNQDDANEVNENNCFFSYYVNPQNLLEFQDKILVLNLGEENIVYEWSIANGTLILKANNTVWLRDNNGDTKIEDKTGELSFEIQRKGKVLVLHRYNATFTETYTFSSAK